METNDKNSIETLQKMFNLGDLIKNSDLITQKEKIIINLNDALNIVINNLKILSEKQKMEIIEFASKFW